MDLEKILKKASLKLQYDTNKFLIKSVFRFSDRGNLGMIFIGLLALAGMIATLLKVEEIAIILFALIIGLFMLIFSILGILKQISDFVEISNRKIRFSNSLKKHEFLIKSDFKIKVKSSIEHVKSRKRSSGSYFCVVELFLKTSTGKFRILDYSTYKKDASEAKELGKEIKKMIEARLV